MQIKAQRLGRPYLADVLVHLHTSFVSRETYYLTKSDAPFSVEYIATHILEITEKYSSVFNIDFLFI